MDEKNKDKIKNIVTRGFRSLPIAADLPRLAKQIRVFHDNSLIYPPNLAPTETTNNLTITENLFHLLSDLSRILMGTQQEKIIQDTFPKYFRMPQKKDDEPHKKDVKSIAVEGIDKLQDQRLKEALLYLVEAFVGCDQSAVFLFNLDKPTSQVLLSVSSTGVKLKEIKPNEKV
jgi:hypothetical protein